jgi:ParB family transcriptional regulator, chromosome partitioning protein
MIAKHKFHLPIAEMPIAEIRVGVRHRKDLGNIEELASNLAELGLLHPIVVTPGKVLIAGARRLLAFKKLGRENIPVTVIDRARCS